MLSARFKKKEEKKRCSGDTSGGNLQTREKWRGREREKEEREQHRCQGFPVQCTETRANTTIRMSREIVK